ncbi:MAG TPA: DUF6580 family putative transport protein [Desulfuromonadaceae bacterium]|nr:DUF6580 family putative transport protein [Desulfuromonadaceae bacterium]
MLPIFFIGVLAISRIPGLLPLDFSAVYAFVFCAGVYFRGSMAWWLPLGTLVATDVALYLLWYGPIYEVPFSHFLQNMWTNYLVYVLMILIGRQFGARASFVKLLSGSLLGAIIFYLIGNTWAWIELPAYAKTFAGWIQALWSGLPGLPPSWMFFRNTLFSAGLFTALFVGAEKLASALAESPADKKAGATEAEGQSEAEPEEAGA